MHLLGEMCIKGCMNFVVDDSDSRNSRCPKVEVGKILEFWKELNFQCFKNEKLRATKPDIFIYSLIKWEALHRESNIHLKDLCGREGRKHICWSPSIFLLECSRSELLLTWPLMHTCPNTHLNHPLPQKLHRVGVGELHRVGEVINLPISRSGYLNQPLHNIMKGKAGLFLVSAQQSHRLDMEEH